MTTNQRTVTACVLLGVMIAVCMLWVDRAVAATMHDLAQHSPAFVAPFQLMTTLGKSVWYLPPLAVVAAVALWLSRRRDAKRSDLWLTRSRMAAFLFANIAISGLVTDAIKILVGRPRPVLLDRQDIFNDFTPFLIDSQYWSFPSGHTTTVMALALALGGIFPRWRTPVLIFAGLIASSRIIVAAHYPGDIIGGVAVACLVYGAVAQAFAVRRWNSWKKAG